MKKIILILLAAIAVIAVRAQKKEAPYHLKESRDKMMAEKLKFSEEQRQKAKTINDDFRKKMAELKQKEDITVKEWRNQMMELNRKHRDDLKGLLNSEQKAQLEKMKLERKKIADIDEKARMEKMKTIRGDRSTDMLKKREELRSLMQQRNQNMKSILTEEQQKKMQELRKQAPGKRRVLS